MYRHLVNEIAVLQLVIISDLALVIYGPLSTDRRSRTGTDHFVNIYKCQNAKDNF